MHVRGSQGQNQAADETGPFGPSPLDPFIRCFLRDPRYFEVTRICLKDYLVTLIFIGALGVDGGVDLGVEAVD
jgi:hypothetical protein